MPSDGKGGGFVVVVAVAADVVIVVGVDQCMGGVVRYAGGMPGRIGGFLFTDSRDGACIVVVVGGPLTNVTQLLELVSIRHDKSKETLTMCY